MKTKKNFLMSMSSIIGLVLIGIILILIWNLSDLAYKSDIWKVTTVKYNTQEMIKLPYKTTLNLYLSPFLVILTILAVWITVEYTVVYKNKINDLFKKQENQITKISINDAWKSFSLLSTLNVFSFAIYLMSVLLLSTQYSTGAYANIWLMSLLNILMQIALYVNLYKHIKTTSTDTAKQQVAKFKKHLPQTFSIIISISLLATITLCFLTSFTNLKVAYYPIRFNMYVYLNDMIITIGLVAYTVILLIIIITIWMYLALAKNKCKQIFLSFVYSNNVNLKVQVKRWYFWIWYVFASLLALALLIANFAFSWWAFSITASYINILFVITSVIYLTFYITISYLNFKQYKVQPQEI
ncbi:hypothetical protein [Mycoplasma nasistruthionis]|uniref:Uncharacterized protein n=1 Tax=Mycoplasma nasistruthionis TaxID=353852 RepID=A0A5B7XXS5_9MOLU|nr:hypothetical protein [Mycoplasma nasistruthionis]QCZ36723.1 hypothetical protein FG904_01720 [Mycoplasma nasistruthionis]